MHQFNIHNQDITEIVVYHSNDLHSRLENAAKIATIIEQGRKQYSHDHVIAVDLGDHMDRSRRETEGTDGLVHQHILNETAYDVITLGNNEGLTFTLEQLSTVYEQRSFDIICCNLQRSDGTLPSWLKSSTIVEKSGVRVGFVAATANFPVFYEPLGWQVFDPLEAIQEEVQQLRKSCDVVIMMSHLGIRYDEKIADQCEGIDIIFGSHTHHTFDPPQYRNGKLMCAAGKYGSYVGKVVIKVSHQTKQLHCTGELIPTAAYPEHEMIQSIIAKGKEMAFTKLNRTITMLKEPLEASDIHESTLPNLLALGLLQYCGGDLALVNTGQLLGGLAEGKVTAGELHSICPSPINACVISLKGRDIWTALEQSLQADFQYKKLQGYGFRGNQLGRLAVAGITVHYCERDLKLKQVNIGNKLLDVERIYKVATIDMFTFNIGYCSLSKYIDVTFFMPKLIRHILELELKNEQHIYEATHNHWIASV